MNFFDTIKQSFRRGNSLIKLIYINSAVFIGLKTVSTLLHLFNLSSLFLISYLAIPADLTQLLYRVWTPISYMFLHENFFHILFNMVALYWFGQIFLMYFSEKQLIGLYLLGGLLAAFFYVAAFNLFPYYSTAVLHSLLLGASGSIMAIIVASAFRAPAMEMQLLFIGGVKLKYIAIVAVLTSFFGISSRNGGGELSHLGGALAGYLFAVSLRQGMDLTGLFTLLLDVVTNLFRPKKRSKQKSQYNMSDAEFNMNKARNMVEIDNILDKIRTSGYESLSPKEKKRLFEQRNKN